MNRFVAKTVYQFHPPQSPALNPGGEAILRRWVEVHFTQAPTAVVFSVAERTATGECCVARFTFAAKDQAALIAVLIRALAVEVPHPATCGTLLYALFEALVLADSHLLGQIRYWFPNLDAKE